MWLLFVVVLLTGASNASEPKGQVVRFTNMESGEQCIRRKNELIKALAKEYPSSMVSLTCLKLNKLGRVS